jgi:hypothetical protein
MGAVVNLMECRLASDLGSLSVGRSIRFTHKVCIISSICLLRIYREEDRKSGSFSGLQTTTVQ